ncbi:hypothetical protein BN7_3165 [Wickerhamomyces ciferrii]|uniref:dTMP kinase n=1 Tax=Wickerhamomyces ciferrii (strain ATCC 14091 / BCRC 22168 / CBS 111 / JCM 3599 / NBRC 0793 / NRRL Y-1031 F-60-10) TaxID=1206466 RepID=K0KN28_WICCF|nr:uncharacterized protein BN7_3165 [Wickerhamomyces ciferrii]CCH43612.1 hypothetical protein BN7_3165 [Wickerhamomyces ciferrii]
MSRGALILIEGLDRAGKTTQTERLVERLKKEGKDVELIKFPAHLLFSANRWELANVIKDKLTQGKYIVLDRYVYSGVAYTAAKGLDHQWCLNPDIGLPKPDLTLFLKLNDSSNREGFGDERYEVKEFQLKVRQQFEKFYNESNWNTIIVDGKNIEQVENEIWNLLEKKLFEPGVNDEINKF